VLGLGQVTSAAPGERTPYFPGPEHKMLHVGYDVKKADEMLDALGLTKKDSAGYRVRVIKNTMGNVPERLWNSAVSDNPHIAHTETWYFKS
jgi:hypothetical protein